MADRSAPTFVNLTPHEVRIHSELGDMSWPSSGVARIEDYAQPVAPLGGVPAVELATGEVVGLPDPAPGVVYIVSRVLAGAVPDRRDVVFPFGEIRDDAGRIVAVSALARFQQNR